MKINEAVSKRIIELCNERNISVNKLAEMTIVPPSTLRDTINCNIEYPKINVIYEVCKACNIEICEFFDCNLFKKLN